MQNLGKIIWISLLSVGLVWADGVEAKVNTQEVVKGNPIQLEIKATGDDVVFPRIQQIAGQYIRSSGSATQSSMSLGPSGLKSESITTYTYLFVPIANMTIPSYTVKIAGTDYKTKAIDIKIVKAAAPKIQSSDAFYMLLKSNKQSVSVGESFVLTSYLYVSQNLRSIQIEKYTMPKSSDFFIKTIEGNKQYTKDGYHIVEFQAVAIAKKEGTFNIDPTQVGIAMPDKSRRDIWGNYRMKIVPLLSNALSMEVKTQKQTTDLIGDFKISTKIDSQKVKANTPVNLIVNIEGKGSLEDFVFPEYDIAGVTVYSDEAKVQSRLVGKELVSTYVKSFAFISEESFSIPARSISMYELSTKSVKNLEIPAYELEVEAKKRVKNTNQTSAVQTKDKNIVLKSKESQERTEVIVEKKVEVEKVTWWMLVLSFVFGMLAMYILPWLATLKRANPYSEAEALKTLYAHIGEDEAVEEMVRKLYAKKHGDKSVEIDKKDLQELVSRFS